MVYELPKSIWPDLHDVDVVTIMAYGDVVRRVKSLQKSKQNHYDVIHKSNSMAGIVQVEANLQEELTANLHYRKPNLC